jgi:radical SAM protein (TIGR01212 family)
MVRKPFLNYAAYLRNKYGQSVYRVSVDAGFSCPNRGPDRSAPGCLYCDERGSRAPYLDFRAPYPDHAPSPEGRSGGGRTGDCRQDLQRQIEAARGFLHSRYGAELFILYFQAFSGTYATVDKLRRIYDFALGCAHFRELAVSTRPDCIDQEKVEMLASYRREDFDVWVELGLQSANDQSLRRINRGHSVEDFHRAFRICRDSGLKLTVHLIFGLPGEGMEDIRRTTEYVAGLNPEAVKIHNLHIPTGCPLYAEYLSGELTVPCAERHLEYTIAALEHLPPDTVIMRLTCDTPELLLAAPRGFPGKARFLSNLRQEMESRSTWQGRLYADSETSSVNPVRRLFS